MKKYSVKEIVYVDSQYETNGKTIKTKKTNLVVLASGLDWKSAKDLHKENKDSYIV